MHLARTEEAGQVVRQRRLDLGLSQAELAQRAGITRQLLSRFEQGKSDLPLSVALQLMRELSLSLDVRTREERAGIVEYRVPTFDTAALHQLAASASANMQAALAQMHETMQRAPQLDASSLAGLQEALSAMGRRQISLQNLGALTRRSDIRASTSDASPE